MRVIRQSHAAGIRRFYISIDGPRNQDDSRIQSSMLFELNKFASENDVYMQIKHFEKNQGLRIAVVEGISWFFTLETSGYILEDDLNLSATFFEFVQKTKGKFESDNRILMISGNQFDRSTAIDEPQLFPYPLIWGWYTNRSKWLTIKSLINFEFTAKRQRRSLRVRSFWKIGQLRSLLGESNSWANPLAGSFLRYGFLCIVPPSNLVSNVGTDSFASHTKRSHIENSFEVETSPTEQAFLDSADWTFPIQKAGFVERHIYRIKFRHNFLILKLIQLQFRFITQENHANKRTRGRSVFRR